MNHRALSLVVCLIFTGCSGVKHEIAESSARNMEFQLHEAGFKILLADTQERQDLLTKLPPGKVSRLPLGGRLTSCIRILSSAAAFTSDANRK